MSKDPLTKGAFEKLLAWLHPDPDQAAAMYNRIHLTLVRIFSAHGCLEPERLADETFDRVLPKIDRLIETYVGNPVHYLRGVAANLIKEDYRERMVTRVTPPVNQINADEDDELFNCFDECMEKLNQYGRRLLVSYYEEQGNVKIANRRKLAEELGITLRALRLRVFHLRSQLKICMEICLQGEVRP